MNGEFKGKTQEAINTLKEDVQEIKDVVGKLDKKIWLILLVLVLFFAEKAPSFIGTVLAWGK